MTEGRLVTLGESLGVLRGSGIGTLAHVGELVVGIGGAEGNVAIGAARLGAAVTWMGRVGNDGLGRRVVRELRGEGVDVRAVVDAEAPTGLLLKETVGPGRTRVTYWRAGSAGSRLSPADAAGLELQPQDVLHVTGITPALSPSAHEAVWAAIAQARAAGAGVSFDVNHRASLWADPAAAAAAYRELVAAADVVFAGDDEARLVLGSDEADPAVLATQLAALGPREAVVKLGERGAVAWVHGEVLHQEAVRLTQVVDTVGAGDAFVAGYLAERLAGAAAVTRLATGAAAGAAVCLHPGDWEGAPTRAELVTSADPVMR